MKRVLAIVSIAALYLIAGAQAASAQTTITMTVTGCEPTSTGVSTIVRGTLTPIPQTPFKISIVSNVQGEVAHISLPAGFDISDATATFLGPAPLGQLTAFAYQDLDGDDFPDPGEIFAISSVKSPCHPGPPGAEQCSNGNWRAFGWFASQGDCVAFFRTRGANPPGQTVPNHP